MSQKNSKTKHTSEQTSSGRAAIISQAPSTRIRRGSLQTARKSLAAQAQAIRRLAREIGSEFNGAVKTILGTKGRVIVSGLGKSGLVGQKIAATFSSTGTASFFLHPVEAFHGDLGCVIQGDVALLLSNSGETEELVELIPCLRRLSCSIIAMCGVRRSTIAREADIFLEVSVEREVCPNNLAPTTSTLAMMAMGDALAVALIKAKNFQPVDFALRHPGGALGRRLLTKIRDVMHKELPTINPHASFQECLLAMTAGRLGLVIVMDEGRLAGIITDGDLRRGLLRDPCITGKPAHALMTANPKTARAGSLLAEAEIFMKSHKVRALVVTEDNSDKVCGVLEIFD